MTCPFSDVCACYTTNTQQLMAPPQMAVKMAISALGAPRLAQVLARLYLWLVWSGKSITHSGLQNAKETDPHR